MEFFGEAFDDDERPASNLHTQTLRRINDEQAARIAALEAGLLDAIALLWGRCEGLVPQIERLERIVADEEPRAALAIAPAPAPDFHHEPPDDLDGGRMFRPLAPAPAPDDKWSKRRSDGHWRTDAQEAKAALAPAPAPARHRIEHDGFVGTVIGHYTRLDGKRGVVMQQDGTNVVHVYGEKWLAPAPAPKDTP